MSAGVGGTEGGADGEALLRRSLADMKPEVRSNCGAPHLIAEGSLCGRPDAVMQDEVATKFS